MLIDDDGVARDADAVLAFWFKEVPSASSIPRGVVAMDARMDDSQRGGGRKLTEEMQERLEDLDTRTLELKA